MSNNLNDQNGSGGALPSLDNSGNEEVLGMPESKLKAKTNVGKTFYLIAFLAGALFLVFGVLFFIKARTERAEAAAKLQAPQSMGVKVDQTKVRNATLENQSLERVKAEIKKKQEMEEEVKAAEVERTREAALKAAGAQANAMDANGGAGGRPGAPGAPGGAGGANQQQAQPAPRRLTLQERQLAGSVMAFNSTGSVPSSAAAQVTPSPSSSAAPRGSRFASDEDGDDEPARAQAQKGGGGLSDMLKPTVLEPRRAGRLGNMDYLLKKGMTIPCALRTGIDTTLPGFLTCVAISDVYSANGVTKLVDRGATFFGEQKSAIAQGQARVFVVWNRIDNPSGIFAELDSPATDEMGYSGIGGHVDDRFWKRFGGAIMLSLIQDTLSAAVQEREASGQVSVNNTSGASSQMATEALKGTINIPPTITVLPGKIINVMVARDVSFESVYGLVK